MKIAKTPSKILFFLILVLSFSLLLLYSYINYYEQYPSIDHYIAEPEKFDGKYIEVVGDVEGYDGKYYFFKSSKYLYRGSEGNTIRVQSDQELRPSKSGFVSVYGVFHKEDNGFVELEDVHYHDYDNFKYYVSLIGLAIFLFIFFKEWKFSNFRFELRRKKNA